MSAAPKELIVVRALTRSELGLFAAQRPKMKSKQRALNINVTAINRMLGADLIAAGSTKLDCTFIHGGQIARERRLLKKTHKNWRLSGSMIRGAGFVSLREGDFVLIRCIEGNDGSSPLALSIVSQADDSVVHSGLAKTLGKQMEDGMTVIDSQSTDYGHYIHLCPRELIVIRSLAESDLSVFDAHREDIVGRQRAFNINALVARQMLCPTVFDAGGRDFDCRCVYQAKVHQDSRPLTKVGKNWRLGGKKYDGAGFGEIGCKDFLLIRSVEWNDGSHPFNLSFVTKKNQRVAHAGLVDKAGPLLRSSMTAISSASPLTREVAKYCPLPPARGANGKRPANGKA